MLQITVPGVEMYDEVNNLFIHTKERTLQLEHSLVSLSKWESKWGKPFLSKKNDKTDEQVIDYIKCMTVTQNVDPEVYNRLTKENYEAINKYINSPMTATTFNKAVGGGRRGNDVVTAEIIYWWMIALNIPMSCEKWHLNRLITLVRVCNEKNNPGKKMSSKAIASQYASLNAARLQQLNSKG